MYLFQDVIPIEKQLEYFRECKERMEGALGKEGIENHVKNAVFFISAGTNDFVLNYFTLPVRRKSFTLLAYQHFLIQHVKQFIQVWFITPMSLSCLQQLGNMLLLTSLASMHASI